MSTAGHLASTCRPHCWPAPTSWSSRETVLLRLLTAAYGRYWFKSLFALLIKNSKGYRRDVRVNMWGTLSPDDKLVSDLAKATEAIKIAARRSDSLMAGKLSPLNFGLLQQYRHIADFALNHTNSLLCCE